MNENLRVFQKRHLKGLIRPFHVRVKVQVFIDHLFAGRMYNNARTYHFASLDSS